MQLPGTCERPPANAHSKVALKARERRGLGISTLRPPPPLDEWSMPRQLTHHQALLSFACSPRHPDKRWATQPPQGKSTASQQGGKIYEVH
ncbi:hypothetical protein E2C01_091012 [Portunus trituberculatus]|uniref:Uncharacterized protein n=1 Tax=Portunus trituberculatus TaxID=210409 RepID=A0A5B7JN95_PORTR|nr:hypothetical protein [Portunus trituberculatus]